MVRLEVIDKSYKYINCPPFPAHGYGQAKPGLWSPRINTSKSINFTLLQNSIKVDIWKINQQDDWVVSYFTMSWFALNESIYRLLAIIIDTKKSELQSLPTEYFSLFIAHIFSALPIIDIHENHWISTVWKELINHTCRKGIDELFYISLYATRSLLFLCPPTFSSDN